MIWPASVHLKQNELFSSWLTRLAYSHNQHIEFFKEIWPHWDFKDVDLDVGIDIAKELAAYTTVSLASIRNAFIGNHDNPHLKWLLPIEDINRAKNRYGLMICPSCLQNDGEEPYHRKLWRMGFSFVCVECQCYLLDRCPACRAPLSVFNHKVMARSADMVLPLNLCFSCRFDLRKSTLIYPKSYWLDLQSRINSIVNETTVTFDPFYNENRLYTLCKGFGNRGMANEELAIAIADELRIPRIRRSWKDTKGFVNMGIERRKYYLMISDWLLSDLPGRKEFIARHYKVHLAEQSYQVLS